ncbi:DUF1236 domain-containing protein [Tardiphaga robiniae]|nr:DUF1236 domain-containing protein [Tardiphaga robiniae]
MAPPVLLLLPGIVIQERNQETAFAVVAQDRMSGLDSGGHKMNRRLMGSAAAIALIATTAFALAQGGGASGSKGGDAPAAASAPRAGEAPSTNMPAAKGTASDGKSMTDSRSAPDAKAASDQKAAPAKPATTAQDKPAVAPSDKAGTSAQERTDTKGAKSATDTKSTTDTKAATDAKTGDGKAGSASTTGNAATSATVALPAEKRTQITSAIRQEKVEEVRNVNFNISVGVTVPSTVRVHPLPTRVIEIYPEWRGYDFILVNGRYVILRPQTHEIVYIIEG